MPEELIISVLDNETRVGVVSDGLLQEIFMERSGSRGTVGNIYKGKVVRILPGMQSAFVDIGEERAAFMHVSDLIDSSDILEKQPGPKVRDITQLLRDGEEVLAQVTKEPINTCIRKFL